MASNSGSGEVLACENYLVLKNSTKPGWFYLPVPGLTQVTLAVVGVVE